MGNLFTVPFQNVCPNIVPTQEELVSHDLPSTEVVSATNTSRSPIPTISAVKPNQAEPQELTGFEDFSSKPSEQLVRKSSQLAGTSSPPSPKIRKNVLGKKSILLEVSTKEKIENLHNYKKGQCSVLKFQRRR